MRELTVATVMTSPIVTVSRGTGFKALVGVLDRERISAVVVVDACGRPIGVVSEADLLAKQEFHGGADPVPRWVARRRRTRAAKATALTAADLMTVPVLTIAATAPVGVAARRLVEERVRRLFVVNGSGELVGVVARRDVLRVYRRADDDIAAEVREQVLRHTLLLMPGTVDVRVSDGFVHLSGAVEHRSSKEMAERLVLATPGVVGVRNDVRHVVDDTRPSAGR